MQLSAGIDKSGQWVDVFSAANYLGDRRRFFAPARIDAAMLAGQATSIRLGEAAQVCLVHRNGGITRLTADSATIDLQDVATVEIAPTFAAPSVRRAA